MSSLGWHGVNPIYLRPQPSETSAQQALTRVTGETKPSMLVMGHHTHRRLRQAFLAGMTRHVLEHADIPVLMIH